MKESRNSGVWGEHRQHNHLSLRNLMNMTLFTVALWPSVVFSYCSFGSQFCKIGWKEADSWLLQLQESFREANPVLAVNILFFLNVTIGFWLVGLLQRTFWLIDPYWTILPPLIGFFFRYHPMAIDPPPLRANVAMMLLTVWSIRLTHNYFRREGWKFGEREDWRYSKMARENPQTWWILSFFAVGLAQQPMLVGVSLPLASAHHLRPPGSAPPPPWGGLDWAATVLAVTGVAVAFVADNQALPPALPLPHLFRIPSRQGILRCRWGGKSAVSAAAGAALRCLTPADHVFAPVRRGGLRGFVAGC